MILGINDLIVDFCGWDEVKAAYRLLSNKKVDGQKILEPHSACTEERMRKYPIVLCIQDHIVTHKSILMFINECLRVMFWQRMPEKSVFSVWNTGIKINLF